MRGDVTVDLPDRNFSLMQTITSWAARSRVFWGLIPSVLAGLWLAIGAVDEASAAGKKYALIVGVKKYRPGQPLPPLNYTENDAEALAKVLTAGGYDVTLMTQAAGRVEGMETYAPQANYIRDQLDAILGNKFLTAEDVVLVALTGHGVQYEFIEGNQRRGKFYFCPADADIAKLKTANEITDRNELLDLGELYTALSGCKAGGKLLLVDACRNDPSKPAISRSANSVTLPPLPPPPGGIAAYFSCSAHEQAIEDPDLKHGVFFHHIIGGLNGDADAGTANRPADGEITLAELSEHVGRSTYDFVRKKYGGARQTPELRGEFRISMPLLTLTKRTVIPAKVDPFVGQTAGEAKNLAPGMKFHWCPPTSMPFLMGSPESELGHGANENQVQVSLSSGFWMAETEVTQEQWVAVMQSSPWKGQDYVKLDPKVPAVCISHGDAGTGVFEADSACEFCRRLTERERRAGRLPTNWKYALPTEAQWEYACRAGSTTAYYFGDDPDRLDDYAWNSHNSSFPPSGAHPVGLKTANKWGLHDMHGNVSEWCSDWFGETLAGGKDPTGPARGTSRINRGGAWTRPDIFNRSASRSQNQPEEREDNRGFRVAATPVSE